MADSRNLRGGSGGTTDNMLQRGPTARLVLLVKPHALDIMSARWPSDVPGRWPSLRRRRKHSCKQPSHSHQSTAEHISLVTDNLGTQTRLGCMLSRIGSGNGDADILYPLQAAMLSIRTNGYCWIRLDPSTRTYNRLRPPSPRSLVSPQGFAASDIVTFASSMLNSENVCAASSLETAGLHCEPSTQSLGKTSIRTATACEKRWAKGQTHASQKWNNLARWKRWDSRQNVATRRAINVGVCRLCRK